jgi:hypothetical protein
LSTSKIVGKILRPDQTEVDDYGWQYDFNVVKVANGYFDIQTETSLLGESADPEFGYNTYTNTVIRDPNPGSSGGYSIGEVLFSFRRAASTNFLGGYLRSIELEMEKVGNPTDAVTMHLETDASGLPSGTVVASSLYSVSSFLPAFGDVTKTFQQFVFNTRVSAYSKIWCVLGRTGSLDSVNYFQAAGPNNVAVEPYTVAKQRSDDFSWSMDSGDGWNMKQNYTTIRFGEIATLFYKIL